MQYVIVRRRQEITSAVGSALSAYMTDSELWSYSEDAAKAYSEKDADQLVLEFTESDTSDKFFYYKQPIS